MSRCPNYIRSVLITGGTGSIGHWCGLTIAKQYPEYLVVLASRNDPAEVAQAINRATGQSNAEYLALDLSALAATREFADRWASGCYPPIAALVLNARVLLPGDLEYTSDGIEKSFGINHCRIIVTSSDTHDPAQKGSSGKPEYLNGDEMAHPTKKTAKHSGMWRYGTSKLTNVMWTYALHRRMQGRAKWIVAAFNPGLTPGTGLGRNQPAVVRFVWYHILPHILPFVRALILPNVHTAQESGTKLASLAIDNHGAAIAGKYIEHTGPAKTSADSYDQAKQEDLWHWTVQTIGTDETERQRFGSLSV